MMIWSFVTQFLTLLLNLLTAHYRTERAKDLEIALLRQQLRVLQRQQDPPLRLRRAERLIHAVVAHRLSALARTARYRWHAS